MNLVEAAEELTYVPIEQLTQMMSDPNSRHPSFLVLSEVQRRNQMKEVMMHKLRLRINLKLL